MNSPVSRALVSFVLFQVHVMCFSSCAFVLVLILSPPTRFDYPNVFTFYMSQLYYFGYFSLLFLLFLLKSYCAPCLVKSKTQFPVSCSLFLVVLPGFDPHLFSHFMIIDYFSLMLCACALTLLWSKEQAMFMHQPPVFFNMAITMLKKVAKKQ